MFRRAGSTPLRRRGPGVRRALSLVVGTALAAGATACLGDTGADALRARVTELAGQRDALQSVLDEVQDRHDRTASASERLRQILADPDAFGTEEEVVAQLAQMATSTAMMRDDVFGSTVIRDAWQSALYGWGPSRAMDARVDERHHWLSEDGSLSGSLWVWHGLNPGGHPFELVGVQLSRHDETGRTTEIRIHYPYPDQYVLRAVDGPGNGELPGLGTPP